MILQAVNVADWSAFYANPVKFGLGFVSIFFDMFFMIQHYVLYRDVEVSSYSNFFKIFYVCHPYSLADLRKKPRAVPILNSLSGLMFAL